MRLLIIMCVITVGMVGILSFSGCNCPGCGDPSTDGGTAITTNNQDQPAEQSSRLQSVRSPQRSENAGHLAVDKLALDFGEVEPGEDLSGKFILTNDGNENLTISTLEKSCTCTVGKLKVPVTLKPGESVPLDVNFHTPPSPGRVLQQVTVTVKPPALPAKVTVSVTAHVKKIVTYQPEQLEFELRDEVSRDYEIVLESTDGNEFTVGAYTCSQNAFKLNFDRSNKATKHVLKISDIDYERMRLINFGYLNMKILHPKIQDITIPFRAITPYAVHPPVGRLYNLEPGKTQTAVIKIVSNFNEDFEVGKIQSQKDLIKIKSTTKTTDGYRIEIELTPPEDTTKIIFMDQLGVEILGARQENLVVPCYGYLKPKK